MHPNSDMVESGLSRFAEEVIFPFQNLFDGRVLIEDQPFIYSQGKSETDRLMNFRLQQMEMGLRGLVIGAGMELHTVKPIQVRTYLGTVTGDYALNKKEHIRYCSNLGMEFTELPSSKRCHVADTVCNAIYLLSKTFKKFELNDVCEFKQPYRAECQKFKKRNAHPDSKPPPVGPKRCGGSTQQQNSPPGK
jgi:hypothetical protein